MTDTVVEFDAGVTNNGEAVRGFRLESDAGVGVSLLSYGAHLVAVDIPDSAIAEGRIRITDGPTTVAALEQTAANYQGATIGRYANRIAGAGFVLDGVRYELPANQGPHHLHGGPHGFASRVWDAAALDDAPSSGPGAQGSGVRFELSSPAGDSGYPGTVEVHVTYRLVDNRLEIVYAAVTDAPTPISLTNHTYWNLAGVGAGSSVADHSLTVHSDRVLIPDTQGIPQPGPPLSVAGTRFSMQQAPLGPVLDAGGLDHCYVIAERVDSEALAGETDPVIELRHPASGRSLTIATDQPGVQVYTGNHFDPPFRSAAFEPQAWPNSPNRPDFPSAIVRPGETYRQHSTYRFGW